MKALNQLPKLNPNPILARKASRKALTMDTINPQIKIMQYAVRGPLVRRAMQLEKELKAGAKKPFKRVIRANVGDCHAMGQVPITFIRQVLATLATPSLLTCPKIPDDVKRKARVILNACNGCSIGAYTDPAGLEIIRKHVAKYLGTRDGTDTCYENVFLSTGASDAIKNVLALLTQRTKGGKKPGFMVPIPQYPLYSALATQTDMHLIKYYLDESKNWGLDCAELERAVNEAKPHCDPRVLSIINPGNPTGQVLARHNLEDVIKFAYKEQLFLFSDEVYQYNVYAKGSEFFPMKKVMMEMGEPYNKMAMACFMSASKGYTGECGLRGGFGELVNFPPEAQKIFFKCFSTQLCPNTIGQATIDCIVDPPRMLGDPSYEQFTREKNSVLKSLKKRARLVVTRLNELEGYKCNDIQGAMYAFPSFQIPPKAVEAAKKAQMPADTFYCWDLLEQAGICVVPGSGFGQRPGTWHFRTTILPQQDELEDMLERFQNFHSNFLSQYE